MDNLRILLHLIYIVLIICFLTILAHHLYQKNLELVEIKQQNDIIIEEVASINDTLQKWGLTNN